jgi:hypothetical protein
MRNAKRKRQNTNENEDVEVMRRLRETSNYAQDTEIRCKKIRSINDQFDSNGNFTRTFSVIYRVLSLLSLTFRKIQYRGRCIFFMR